MTSFSFSSPVAIRSQMRPGVPTTMSAPPRMRCTCMERLTPPSMATMRMLQVRRQTAQAGPRSAERELARRGEDQGARGVAVRLRGFVCQVLQHGQREGGGLAGAGLGDAEQVAAGEQGRNGGCLDWRWFDVSRLCRGRAAAARQGRGRQRNSMTRSYYAPTRIATGSLPRRKPRALVFACPRDNGANALQLEISGRALVRNRPERQSRIHGRHRDIAWILSKSKTYSAAQRSAMVPIARNDSKSSRLMRRDILPQAM